MSIGDGRLGYDVVRTGDIYDLSPIIGPGFRTDGSDDKLHTVILYY